MTNYPVSITITERKEHPKVLGVAIPFVSYSVSNGDYSSPGRFQWVTECVSSPLECLTELLVNIESNRDGKQIGPISATFDIIGEGRAYGIAMEEILKIYARSERTNVTFEYKG
jgi:hypothetical protein